MATLHLTAVPDELAEKVRLRAASEGLSVDEYIIRSMVRLVAEAPSKGESPKRIPPVDPPS